MPDDDLAFASASDMTALIRSKQVSSLELTNLFLKRIESTNHLLNAYLTVASEQALESAKKADQALARGNSLGSLHGIPIAIKDLDLTRGIRTTMGSLLFKDQIPDKDSIVVERVRKSGAIILGKTNAPEFGLSGTTENKLGDACRNPWDRERTSGGSSGGAGAAVAAGLCAVATGSDGGGSIRIPASFCGVYGIKPTQGRVPRTGADGVAAYNTFGQAGPITRTVRDAALLLQTMTGPDSRDPGCIREEPPDFVGSLGQGVRGLRVGWSPDLGYAPVDPEVSAICSRAALAFTDLGCVVEEAEVGLDDPYPIFWDNMAAFSYTTLGHLLNDRIEELEDYSRKFIEHGLEMTASDYSMALHGTVHLQARMQGLFEKFDLLLTPTVAVPAFPIGQNPVIIGGKQVEPFLGFTPLTYPFNLSMQPAASVPCGFSSDGLPIGLQIVGRCGEEKAVLRASAAFEQARPWLGQRPTFS